MAKIINVVKRSRSEVRKARLFEQKKKKNTRVRNIHCLILAINIAIVIALSSYNLIAVSLYSWFWYLKGYGKDTIDEADEGSIRKGLIYLVKSWIWGAGIIYLIWRCSP